MLRGSGEIGRLMKTKSDIVSRFCLFLGRFDGGEFHF